MFTRFLSMLAVSVLLLGVTSSAEEPKSTTAKVAHMVVLPDDIKWLDGPPGLPAGAKIAVLDGDPSKSGSTFAMRAKLPAGYIVPPHWHSVDEVITVLDGSFGIGVGEKLDKSAVRYMPPGTFMRMGKGEKHYAMTKSETIIQINGVGPFDITYVNESDDPRKK